MSPTELKARARALWLQLRVAGGTGQVSDYVAPEYRRTEPSGEVTITGLDGFQRMIDGAHVSLPDVSFALEDQIEQGDLIATRWVATATHGQVWRGAAPTQQRFQFSGVTLSRFKDGKVLEEWMHWDGADALARLADGANATDLQPESVDPLSVTRSLWRDVWSKGELEHVERLVARDYVRHDGLRPVKHGRVALLALVASARDAFPDLRTEVEHELVEDNKVVTFWTSAGTHLGRWGDQPPSGRQIAVRGCTVSRIHRGQVAEEWCYWDRDTLERLVGVDR